MGEPARVRVDKWLWYARFFKTRSLASKIVASGVVRLNTDKISKPSAVVQPDDVLTFPQGRVIRVIRVLSIGSRRGPAAEAQGLYEDLTPPSEAPENAPVHPGQERSGRPTKKERRELDAARRSGP